MEVQDEWTFGSGSLGTATMGTFGDSHKVKLGRNDRKQTVSNWEEWRPVCGCPQTPVCEQADKGSQLILVVLCLNLGCAGFKKYRRDKIAE